MSLSLKSLLALLAIWAMPAVAHGASPSAVTAPAALADGIENLKKTLAEVLRARRPQEFAFLDRVVELVDQGTLPRSLVESTFNWARKKPRHPFQYFEFGLKARAKEIGIEL
jgi:hypothetical protein